MEKFLEDRQDSKTLAMIEAPCSKLRGMRSLDQFKLIYLSETRRE